MHKIALVLSLFAGSGGLALAESRVFYQSGYGSGYAPYYGARAFPEQRRYAGRYANHRYRSGITYRQDLRQRRCNRNAYRPQNQRYRYRSDRRYRFSY